MTGRLVTFTSSNSTRHTHIEQNVPELNLRGQVVNLVSNDVRRFDDSAVFWVFLWAGPLELVIMLALLIELLGPAAAFAGVASLLLVIPVQVWP